MTPDTNTTFEELEAAFGAEVAGLVGELTDDKGLPKQERKDLQVAHARDASPAAKRIKLADKICNVRDIHRNPPSDWAHDRRVEYLDWAERVVAGCRGAEPVLERILDAEVATARETLAG